MYKLVKNWPKLNIIIAIIIIILTMMFSSKLMFQQRALLLESMFISLHIFEEYGMPGKMPKILNKEKAHSESPKTYPYNLVSAMILNYGWAIILFGLPMLFPKIYWLVLAPVLFGFIEFLLHLTYYPKGTYLGYSSGLITTILGFIPIGILYLSYASVMNMVSIIDIIYALIYSGILYFIFFYLGRNLMVNKNTNYPFPDKNINDD